jgi:hypothetical protein
MEQTKRLNPWLEHVKAMREKNPDIKYKELLQLAKESYVKPVKEAKQQKVKSTRKQKVIDQDLEDEESENENDTENE